MTEIILLIFAALLIYYVATRVAPQGLIFKLKKEEKKLEEETQNIKKEEARNAEEELIKEGQDIFNKGEFNAAEKKFLEAIKNDPAASQAYHFLGMIYLRQKLYKGAIAALEKTTQLDPLDDTAFNNLGLSYMNTDNYAQAVEKFEKSISLNDKIAHRYLNLALAYQKTENFEKAAIALENAVKIHANTENLTLLAKNYLTIGDKKLAKKTLERLLEVDNDNSWAKRQISTL